MGKDCILAIDQGTTNTKALLVDRAGAPAFRASLPVSMITTSEGFSEQDPELLWESVAGVIADAVQYANANAFSIRAIAISNQRETALAWDAESGRAAAPAISWQCGRGSAICNRLAPHARQIRAKTGLPLAPLISATKWAWLLQNDAATMDLADAHRLRLGTVDTWLIHKLTSGEAYSTDLTNASRTGLLNLAWLTWDPELLECFDISPKCLPELRSSAGMFGNCKAVGELSGVPIMSAIGDSHAAMFGHGHHAAGSIKATYGTGSSLMALTPDLISETAALARTIAWAIQGVPQYAVEGNIAMTGSAIQWLGEFLALPDPTRDVVALADTVKDAAGVFFVPAMVGLGAPWWDADARGAISGLGRHYTRAHLARAAIDSIAFQVADVFAAMEAASGMQFTELRADGGATRNASLMQFQADILACPVVRSRNEELSAIGAAWLSGLALGWWKSLDEIAELPSTSDRYEPAFDPAKREQLYAGWNNAVKNVLSRKAVYA